MSFLRTAPTRKLLTTFALALLAVIAGTAIAVAATSGGPVPARKSLAAAIHSALAAKAPKGLSGYITFTNGLIGSSDLTQGAGGPLLTGGSGRLWLSGDHLRIEIQGDPRDAEIVVNGVSVWAYDPSSNAVYRATLPAQKPAAIAHHGRAAADALPSIARIQQFLSRHAAHLSISAATPTDVAGQPAYRVSVAPKAHSGLLGRLALAWDAIRGVPLDFAVYAKGDSSAVLELKMTGISYGSLSPRSFAISPPAGAKVVTLTHVAASHASGARRRARYTRPRALPFAVNAPSTLAGMARAGMRRLGDAEAITYGKGLDGVVVLERKADISTKPMGSSGANTDQGLSLPTVSIDGITAQLLATPLGTVLEFNRAGIAYVVAGSVPSSTAEAAARGL